MVQIVRPGGFTRVHVDTNDVANSGVGETNLMTFTLTPAMMPANGSTLRGIARGVMAANANTKTLRLYVGATSITLGSSGFNNTPWAIFFELIRNGVSDQDLGASIIITGPGGTSFHANPTENLAANVTIKITGQSSAASNDITQKMFIIDIFKVS